jgi:hypothetical protein
MSGRCDCDQLVLIDDLGVQARVFVKKLDKPQIDFSIEQPALDGAATSYFQLNRDSRIFLLEPHDDFGKQVSRDRGAGANAKPAAGQLVKTGERQLGLFPQVEYLPGILRQQLPFLCQAHASREPLDERHAQASFKLRELFGNRRLADHQPGRAAADVLFRRHRVEDRQMVQVQRRHILKLWMI